MRLTLAGTSSQELQDFDGAKFYAHMPLLMVTITIQNKEKTLEFSSTVLFTLSLYTSSEF